MESLIQIRAKVDGANAWCAGKQHGKKRAPGEMCGDVGGVMAMQYDLRASLDIFGPWCSS